MKLIFSFFLGAITVALYFLAFIHIEGYLYPNVFIVPAVIFTLGEIVCFCCMVSDER